MAECKECQTTENLVYSGVDALLLGIPGAKTRDYCYACAKKLFIDKEETDGTIQPS